MVLLLIVLAWSGCRSAAEPESAPATFPPAPTLILTQQALAAAPTFEVTVPPAGYPAPPTIDSEPTGYPAPIQVVTLTPTATMPPVGPIADEEKIFVPLIAAEEQVTPVPTPDLKPPTNTPTPTPTPIPTLDFAAIRRDLNTQGQDLSTAKIGFHVSVGGTRSGLSDWMRRLDEAGVPFFLKSVADAGPLLEGQNLIKTSGVPHVLVYRFSGDEYDTPNYDLPPAQAAAEHWALHMEKWPPELDPDIVWLETINEIDKERSEWLALFALETAALAELDGFKWAAFGWSSGEPEVEDWQGPQMLRFLRLAASRPDRLAIALHEYSYITSEIGHQYPYKLGRFQQLFQVCDAFGIPRPTVLITEWGWEYRDIPPPEQALADIEWANRLYAPYPEVKGAAIWYLGDGYGDIHEQTEKLIEPVMIDALTTYFTAPLPSTPAPIEPEKYQP